MGIDPASLVHALQNHDELTHELVHFSTRHRDDLFTFARRGADRLRARASGPRRPQRRPDRRRTRRTTARSRTNGIACTTATVIAATLGIRTSPDHRGRAPRVQARPPAAGEVQRPAAGRLRPLGLGSLGDADGRGGRGRRPDLRGRHALDQPRRARPARRRRPRPRGPHAARPQPLRHAARAALRPDLLRLAPARHHRGPPRATRSPPASRSTSPRSHTAPSW